MYPEKMLRDTPPEREREREREGERERGREEEVVVVEYACEIRAFIPQTFYSHNFITYSNYDSLELLISRNQTFSIAIPRVQLQLTRHKEGTTYLLHP